MIEEVIKNLNKTERDELILALEMGAECLIKLKHDFFVGVNIGSPTLEILEKRGDWYYGRRS